MTNFLQAVAIYAAVTAAGDYVGSVGHAPSTLANSPLDPPPGNNAIGTGNAREEGPPAKIGSGAAAAGHNPNTAIAKQREARRSDKGYDDVIGLAANQQRKKVPQSQGAAM